MEGGTFNLRDKIFFCLCNLTYSGHFTNLDKFLFGCIDCPIPKLFGVDSSNGFLMVVDLLDLAANGAGATFFEEGCVIE